MVRLAFTNSVLARRWQSRSGRAAREAANAYLLPSKLRLPCPSGSARIRITRKRGRRLSTLRARSACLIYENSPLFDPLTEEPKKICPNWGMASPELGSVEEEAAISPLSCNGEVRQLTIQLKGGPYASCK